ncbi:hypothetical protein FS935_19170 [Metabacillus litoralis]|uniref:Uncharacterized protein n=1 Tax=Metabacillus litoralis TaxID=152268 RepID=A0A5C6VLR7_9BACI|nr:hypothetical protein [Metabacillus litoralis]TXC85950.1 hypothetical protein FS935_19170 [Metabacillus litoralis]
MEEKINRIEEMLATLIQKVGKIHEDQVAMREEQTLMKLEQTSMKHDISSMKKEQTLMKQEQTLMKQEQTSLREEMALMRAENEKSHQEIIGKLDSLAADHEHTWEKTVRNEREIAKVKHQFDL